METTRKKDVFSRIAKMSYSIPALPKIVYKIIEFEKSETLSIQNIAEIINGSSGIAANVLKTANSSFFGSGTKITTIRDAIVRIGLNITKNIALSVSILNLVGNKSGLEKKIWESIFITAICSKIITEHIDESRSEELFTAGLISNIGILIFVRLYGDEYLEILRKKFNEGICLSEAEKSTFGVDHAELGGLILDVWKFPESVVRIAENHHKKLSQEKDNLEDGAIVQISEDVSDLLVRGSADSYLKVMTMLSNNFGFNTEQSEKIIERVKYETIHTAKALGMKNPLTVSLEQIRYSAIDLLLKRSNKNEIMLNSLKNQASMPHCDQKLLSLGMLAKGLSHDFNNLVTVIHGGAEMLKEDFFSDCDNEILNSIIRSANESKNLLGQIKVFTKQCPVEDRAINLYQVISETLDIIKITFPKTTKIKTDIDENDCIVYANESFLHRVVMNLLINAAEAIGIKSKALIEIKLKKVSVDKNIIMHNGEAREGEYAKITVSDNGCGMSEGTKRKIFNPCFSTKNKENNQGIGLSSVREIIRNYEGFIIVNSEEGLGTAIDVFLPIHREKP